MAELPSAMYRDVFSIAFDGAYGRFKTAESFELTYLLTSLKLNDLEKLETAAKAFDFRSISFEEVIQRDIDFDRVDRELVEDYLERGKDRVIFFPPLLVSIVAFENGKRIDSYKQVDTEVPAEGRELIRTWDEDKFQIVLPIWNKPTGHAVEHDGKNYNFLPYAVTLRLNPQSVKLVVIDGQHRFMALMRIKEDPEKRYLIKDVEVPVCIFFTPDAIRGTGNLESIVRDLRELFVTINSKAKEVSGHFLVLLNDRSLASHAIRLLADSWKRTDSEGSRSMLPLLEWNTREARKAYQRQKPYSITTVSIISDAFSKYIFARSETTQTLLNLSQIRSELEVVAESPRYNQIDEQTFGIEQIDALNGQLTKLITPSLNVLLMEARPYRLLWEKFQAALQDLERKVALNTPGTKQYRDEVLYQFRRCAKKDQQSVKDAEGTFEASITIDDDDEVFFSNVFQQGLLRAWAELCTFAIPALELAPAQLATALIPALNALVFNQKKRMFEPSRSYLQGLIFDGQKIRVNEAARSQWVNLILGSLLHSTATTAFEERLAELVSESKRSNIRTFMESLTARSQSAISDYVDEYAERSSSDMKRNWRFKDLDQETMTFLLERENSEERRSEYEEKLRELSDARVTTARVALSNLLGLKAAALPGYTP